MRKKIFAKVLPNDRLSQAKKGKSGMLTALSFPCIFD